MANHRKGTPNRPRRQLKPAEIAALVAAFGAVLSGLAAILTALK